MKKEDWFKNWFDSPYYHVLYKNRDKNEANVFIQNLVNWLQLDKSSTVLDLGCGKGRHAIELKKNYKKVVGIDLSKKSIDEAIKIAPKETHFSVHDMRDFQLNESFNAIFNLFTSFGYFSSMSDNLKVLHQCNKHLKAKGLLIIDFLNAEKVKSELVQREKKTIDSITFEISKKIIANNVVKDIAFKDNGRLHNFQESVQLLSMDDFKSLFQKSNFRLLDTFGGYDLQQFNPISSKRLILVAKKLET